MLEVVLNSRCFHQDPGKCDDKFPSCFELITPFLVDRIIVVIPDASNTDPPISCFARETASSWCLRDAKLYHWSFLWLGCFGKTTPEWFWLHKSKSDDGLGAGWKGRRLSKHRDIIGDASLY